MEDKDHLHRARPTPFDEKPRPVNMVSDVSPFTIVSFSSSNMNYSNTVILSNSICYFLHCSSCPFFQKCIRQQACTTCIIILLLCPDPRLPNGQHAQHWWRGTVDCDWDAKIPGRPEHPCCCWHCLISACLGQKAVSDRFCHAAKGFKNADEGNDIITKG